MSHFRRKPLVVEAVKIVDNEMLYEASILPSAGRAPMIGDWLLSQGPRRWVCERDDFAALYDRADVDEIAALEMAGQMIADDVRAAEERAAGLERACASLEALCAEQHAALRRLRIDANRLAGRNLGGTYEQDVIDSIAVVDAVLRKRAA